MALPLWSMSSTGALPDDAAVIEHGDPVGDLADAGHVVGDRQGSGAKLLDAAADQIVDDIGHDRIEAGGRLVEEDDLGLAGDCPGEADALLHAARELGGEQIGRLGHETDAAQCLDGDLFGLGALDGVTGHQAEGDVFPDRQAVEQSTALKQHAELAADLFDGAARGADHLGAIDADRASIRLHQAEHAFQAAPTCRCRSHR